METSEDPTSVELLERNALRDSNGVVLEEISDSVLNDDEKLEFKEKSGKNLTVSKIFLFWSCF